MTVARKQSKCPYCFETIAEKATRCKHCHADLSKKKKKLFANLNNFRIGFLSGILFTLIIWALFYFWLSGAG